MAGSVGSSEATQLDISYVVRSGLFLVIIVNKDRGFDTFDTCIGFLSALER